MEKPPIIAILRAPPGFSSADFKPADSAGPASFLYLPVVAWRVESYSDDDGLCTFSYAYPIGPDETDHKSGTVVRYPDGRFHFFSDEWCDTEATALELAAKRYVVEEA